MIVLLRPPGSSNPEYDPGPGSWEELIPNFLFIWREVPKVVGMRDLSLVLPSMELYLSVE